MLRYRLSGATLLLLIAPSIPLWAQTIRTEPPAPADTLPAEPLGGTQIRRGLWFGGGLGYGSVESHGSVGGTTGTLEGGWNLSRRVALGVGTNVWTRGMGRLGATVGSVDLRARWYPSEMAGGLFFSGAWGLGFIHLSDQLANDMTATGRAFRLGLGYDVRVAPGVSLTVSGSGSKINTYKDGDHMWLEVWQLGLGVTVH
jgi:hypothetical protein